MTKMNSERNPHLLSDPNGCGGGGGGCVIGSSSGPPIHGYGSPQGSGVDMAGATSHGQPCPVPTPPWVKPPSNNGNSGMMTPESDVSSCSSPASTSYGASSTTSQFPQSHLSTHHLQQQQQHHQRSFYGSTNYSSCPSSNSANSSNDPTGGAGAHTTMNQIRGNQNSYCNTNSNAISSSTNSGIFYESAEVVDQSQYYHQQHHSHNSSHNHHHQQQQHHHFHHQQQFDNNMHLQKTGSSSTNSCASLENNVNLSGECVGGDGGASGTNFYGFYNQSGQYGDYHQHHHHHSQHHHDGSTYTGGDGSGGNRMHHQYFRQDGSGTTDASANSVPVGHPNYFNNNISTQNYPTVSGTASTPPTRYGSPMMFPNNQSHQHQQQHPNNNYGTQQQQQQQHHQNLGQIPIRRNSIESFSSEPGDMHSSYTARYGCTSTTNMTQQQLQQISNHNLFPNTVESSNSSGMVKRECMSAGGNTNDGITSRGSPSINPMTPNSSTPTSWSPHPPQGGYFPSSSPSNSCTSSSSPNPCSTNNAAPNRTTFINGSYVQAGQSGVISGESSNCRNNHGNFYAQHHHQQQQQQQHPTQFKSCAYEQSQQHHDIKEGIQLVQSNNASNNLKAASAVKHRSLSLSMPLPSYLENNGSSRPDLEGNFVNHHHRQMQHHHHHGYNPMMDSAQHHQQCTTTGGLIPPDQNLLTPNSDDDMPFRTASAGGQSDLDSSYETMGDEGCSSSTSTSHCMPMNTSGNSACSGSGDNNNGSSMTPDLHSMSIDTSEPDCHHHHHHHNNLPFSTSAASCMQNHVQTSLPMGMLEIPNSTVALCTTNVDDLDDSSSDSSDELHNVISAVVENSSIETPENTMMGDEDDEDVIGQDEGNGDDNCPSESGGDVNRVHYHHSATPDNPADVNVISTTTTDDVDNDNCSESSMNNINSSFTADMFSSNDNSNGMSKNGNEADKGGIDSNSFPCIPEGAHFDDDDDEDDDDNASINSSFSLQLKSCSNTTSSSTNSMSSSSPQKISKRSFSETDKDNMVSATSLTFGASFRTSCASSGSGSTLLSGIGGGGGGGSNDKCVANNDSESSANNKSNSSCSANNGNGMGNNNNVMSSSCKAIGIIISSSNSDGNGSIITASDANGNRVSIPKGWKREVLKGASNDNGNSNNTNTSGVLYISPSDTKIRNLDELKNYIGSDGTCKCGLSCPLRLEVAFSFDPKVTNMTVADEKENLESLATRNDASTSSSSSSSSSTSSSSASATSNATGESDTRLLCNHKRKIPKAEDSPIISSTRDDLGDFGEKLKKRRLSGNECLGEKLVSSGPFRKDPITTSATNNSNNSSSTTTTSQNIPVPFCQQSPDTTTQTPQTEMSPASSVCSDSSTIILSSAGGGSGGGSRSLTSTPTPTLTSSSTASSSSLSSAAAVSTMKIGNSPSQGQGHCEFVWPSPPTNNLSSASSTPPQQLQLSHHSNQPQTSFWLSPTNSSTTFSSNSICSIGNNSLTLNYVQSPNTGSSCTSSGITMANNVISPTTTVSTSGNSNNIIQATTKTTTVTISSAPTTSSSTSTVSSGSANAKKTYLPYPSKNVKRPSSPCPNIDVRQLPLEQNRPPPIAATQASNKVVTIGPVPNNPPNVTNLSLPIVSNPNILFTVAPPIVAPNKTEIVSLSTPTLPILPLLTATGKLEPTSGPTIVTTLQPSTSILGTIDTNALYPVVASKEATVVPLQPKQPTKTVTTVKADASVNRATTATNVPKKVEEASKSEKDSGSIKTAAGKDGKEKPSSSPQNSSNNGEKSPLQMAQDIIDRFEKKSNESTTTPEVVNCGKSSTSGTTTATNSNLPKETIVEDKGKEKAPAKIAKAKDGNKAEEKSSNDSSNVSLTKGTVAADSSTLKQKADLAKSEPKRSDDANKSNPVTGGESKSITPAVQVVQVENKSKVQVDSSKPQTPVPIISSVAPPLLPQTMNTIVSAVNTQPLQQQQQALADTIITSQNPVMSTTPLILKDGVLTTDQGLTLTTSVSGPIPTISLSAMGNQIIQTSGAPVPCSTTFTTGGSLGTFTTTAGGQLIYQQQGPDQGNGANSTFLTSAAAGTGALRYPFLQTIQPLFLNSAGPGGGPLIISQPQSQDPNQANQLTQQSFIYDQNGTPTAIDGVGAFQSMLQPTTTTMVLDPSMCAGNPNLAGGKKKKKRLSKKQQQQQAQLQLQQQLILQQIQAQQQQAAAAAATIPLTIFPQSFNLGPQGFSLQPTMNFFPTPTFLTLPNLILNPADGTLFIQPSTPLPTATTTQMQPTTTMKLGQFPITTTTTVPQNPQNIAPKKDGNIITLQNPNEAIKPASTPGLDLGSDDSRQNPTPDSSTNDLQLGLINVAAGAPQTNTITLNIPAPTTTTVLHNPNTMVNKKNSKSRTVSSSSTTVKRILPQKQILPKIDSTTPSTTENAN
ncbi:unnamed protein product [Orchesella dallaii]|uniref:MBD domain-containing protein n=1 Tax=Orchesella dallaii TaxID=48710 RepID=A0ABP1QTG0_9HEXA